MAAVENAPRSDCVEETQTTLAEDSAPPHGFGPIREPPRAPTFAALAITAVLGMMLRVALLRLFAFAGQTVAAVVIPQALGCVVMGVALTNREKWQQLWPLWYATLATGFCGSLTSFSAWLGAAVNEFVNISGAQRTGFQSFLAGAELLVLMVPICAASLAGGILIPEIPTPAKGAKMPHRIVLRVEAALVALAAAMMVALALIAALVDTGINRGLVYAALLAPAGCILRHEANQLARHRRHWLPVATLGVNITGTLVLGVATVLSHGAGRNSPSLFGGVCALVIAGIPDGFCGCLTTISSLFAECRRLPPRAAALYLVLSVILAGAPLLAIVGGVLWSAPTAPPYPACTF